jgi:hypothetical protein
VAAVNLAALEVGMDTTVEEEGRRKRKANKSGEERERENQ